MSTFRKKVIAPGSYQTPEGPSLVTPERIRHWRDSLAAMLREGYKPPLSWGHVSKALPASDDEQQLWTAKFVAGKITGSEIDPTTGDFYLLGDAPGVEIDAEGRLLSETTLPDGRKVKSAIEEVSIGVRDWTDGKGRLWKDAPVHLALTPLPVWVPEGGQPPFETDSQPAGQHFSLARCLYRFATSEPPMADEKKKDDDKKKPDEGDGGSVSLSEVLELLGEHGITLPDDTDEANFLQHLKVALTVLKGAKGDDPPADDPPVEEASGTYMSTLAKKDPMAAALISHVTEEAREKRETRIKGLVKRGLSPALAKQLREEATVTSFALGADGKPATAKVDEKLALLEQTLPEGDVMARLTGTLTGAKEEETPENQITPQTRAASIADEQAKNSRLKARRTGPAPSRATGVQAAAS